MRALKFITAVMCLAIAALGVLGLVAPGLLLALGSSLLVPPALYAVAAVRVVFGALLISVASATRAPVALRVFGGFIVIAGLVTPLVSVERFGGVVAWLSDRLLLVRVVALAPLLLGLLLLYAIDPKHHAAA